jgi:hypothetical protein
MDNAELSALVELNLAASTLRALADSLLLQPETIRMAEALTFVAASLGRISTDLRGLVVADTIRRAGRPPAPVAPLRTMGADTDA